MTLYRSILLLVASFTYLGFAPSPSQGVMAQVPMDGKPTNPVIANSTTAEQNFGSAVVVAQASPQATDEAVLRVGSQGLQVAELQKSLQRLGYYDQAVDGVYGRSTAQAVSKFQTALGLPADGSVGQQTSERIQSALKELEQKQRATPTPTKSAKSTSKSSSMGGKLWWIIGLVIISIGVGVSVFLLLKMFGRSSDEEQLDSLDESLEMSDFESNSLNRNGTTPHSTEVESEDGNNGHHASALTVPEKSSHSAESTTQPPTSDNLAVQETTRLAKIDIINELIKDLRSLDPSVRRKAIWELAQRGDSRAAQPLVDLMIDSDSQQRSLILEALSQIGTRTLKPMNRALSISLQDENAEVRKNAIRDVTRIYDLVAQITQLLGHAAEDPDPEVQDTVRWAMGQLHRIRTNSGMESLPALPKSDNLADDSAE